MWETGTQLQRGLLIASGALLASGCVGRASEHTSDPLLGDSQAIQVCAQGATVLGVDVSDFQANTSWSAVAGDNRVFAFIKATEGVTYTSPTFSTDWQGTQAAGVYRSAYHFFRPQDDGVAQAQQYLSVAGTDQSGNLPPMLDVEVTDGQPVATLVQRMSDWLTTVQAQTGKTPIIYTSPSFWNSTLGSPAGFSQYLLFVANWGVSCPSLPGQWTNWTFWQSTDSASVSGISGAVDGDEFNGSAASLAALAGGSTCTPSCSGLSCGSDGCGGSCGTCPAGESCSSGQCVSSCVPNCSGLACGDDGCGGSCGTCPSGQTCDSTGQCTGGSSSCAHAICQQGSSLDASCDPCATQVCGQDPYCCSVLWDSICVGEVTSICGQSC
jgi:lysozyme